MKRFTANAISLFLLFVVVGLSWSFATKPKLSQLDYQPDNDMRYTSERMKRIHYSLPLWDAAGYNWSLVYLQYNRRNPEATPKLGLLAADQDIFQSAKSDFSSFDAAALQVFKADGSLDSKRLKQLQAYYTPRKIRFSSVDALHFQSDRFGPAYGIQYTSNSEKSKEVFEEHLELTQMVLAGNGLAFKDLILVPGLISKPEGGWKTVFGGKANYINQAIDRTAKMIFETWRDWELAHNSRDTRIILRNAPRAPKGFYSVGRRIKELLQLRDRILFYNQISFQKIDNAADRVALGVDTSLLLQAGQKKAAKGTNVLETWKNTVIDISLDLQNNLVEKNAQKQVTRRLLQYVRFSYFRPKWESNQGQEHEVFKPKKATKNSLKEKGAIAPVNSFYYKSEDGLYLPYTRAGNRQLLQIQIQLAQDLVALSGIGLNGKRGVVHFHMPKRENMPILHSFIRPILESEKFRPYFILKNDGSSLSEQKSSMDWINHALFAKIP